MTHTLNIDGVAFGSFVDEKTYSTVMEPVVQWEAKTLDGTTRRLSSGAKYRVSAKIFALQNSVVGNLGSVLAAAVKRGYANVTFTSLQEQKDVSAVMAVDSVEFGSLCPYPADGDEVRGFFLRGTNISFREL